MRQTESFPISIPNGRSVGPDQSPAPSSASGPAAITVDYEAYAHFLDGSELSEDQKQALLQSLWNIVVGFVSLGFDVHPAYPDRSPDRNACGQVSKDGAADPDPKPDAVSWINPQLIYEFESASASPAPFDAGCEAERNPHEQV